MHWYHLRIVFLAVSLTIAGSAFGNETERSIALFFEAAKVFKHPRCLNCHPSGERPTQGNDLHAHIMNVQRGPDDHGATAMRCNTCHNESNNFYSEVPGAPKWALAPKRMAWQGLSDRELCRSLKDPAKTGMTADEFIEHNAHDPLVGWGWNPGAGREPVPGTQAEFGQIVADWIGTGAACPGDLTSTLLQSLREREPRKNRAGTTPGVDPKMREARKREETRRPSRGL